MKKFIIILILVLISSVAFAYPNDQDGIMGCKWGSSPDNVNNIKLFLYYDNMAIYKNTFQPIAYEDGKGEITIIVDEILYLFLNNKLVEISLYGKGINDFYNFKTLLMAYFGEGISKANVNDNLRFWYGKITHIILNYNNVNDSWSVEFYDASYNAITQ